MKNHGLTLCLAVCICATTLFAQTKPVPDYFQAVAKIVGKEGTLNADGSYRINLPRTDVKFKNANGMPIPPDLGLSTYIALYHDNEGTLAVGDVAMLEPEIDGVIDGLRAGGYEVVSLHNHMTNEQPRLFYVHFQATGTPEVLAEGFLKAISGLGKKIPKQKLPKMGKPTLDATALQAILGPKPQTFPSGVLRFGNPRKDFGVAVEGLSFLPGMGLSSWAAFYSCECGQTMVMGDTCCVRGDLQAAIDAFRKAGIHVTAIHHHFLGGRSLGETKEVIFMHFEAEGDSLAIAKGVRSCWDTLGH